MLNKIILTVPVPDPRWRSISRVGISGRYALRSRSAPLRAFIEKWAAEGSRFIPAVIETLAPDATAEWSVHRHSIEVLARDQRISPEGLTWAVDSTFAFLGAGEGITDACESFKNAWAPVFAGIMKFAMPFDDVECADVMSGQRGRNVILTRGPLDASEKAAILSAIGHTT